MTQFLLRQIPGDQGCFHGHAANKVTAFSASGCGKSTLLRTFNRLYELYPDQRAEGEIRLTRNILDKKQDITLLRAKVGMVFQKPTPFRCRFTTISRSACAVREPEACEMDDRVEWR